MIEQDCLYYHACVEEIRNDEINLTDEMPCIRKTRRGWFAFGLYRNNGILIDCTINPDSDCIVNRANKCGRRYITIHHSSGKMHRKFSPLKTFKGAMKRIINEFPGTRKIYLIADCELTDAEKKEINKIGSRIEEFRG